MRVKPFVINKHGRLVFPANLLGELDFSVMHTLDQFTAVIGRDFEAKAPTGTDIRKKVETGAYTDRFEPAARPRAEPLLGQPLLDDDVRQAADPLARPAQAPRRRLPPGAHAVGGRRGEGGRGRARLAARCRRPGTPSRRGQAIFDLLFDLFRHQAHHATELPAIKPTVAEFLAQPGRADLRGARVRPGLPGLRPRATSSTPTRTSPSSRRCMRWAMVLHNQYPWDRSRHRAARRLGEIGDDDFVVAFHPRNRDVRGVHRPGASAGAGRAQRSRRPGPGDHRVAPVRALPAGPRARGIRGAAEDRGAGRRARRDRLRPTPTSIRNASFSWSPMSADEIAHEDRHRAAPLHRRGLEQLALRGRQGRAGARRARRPRRSARSWSATCTSNRLIPSLSHAGSPASSACCRPTARPTSSRPARAARTACREAVRLLQEVERPVLLVCVEKFSDKIGAVRTSRMIFGDGAAAIVVAPAAEGEAGDIDVLQHLRQRPVVAGELDHLAEPGVRQRHHRVRPRGEGARGPLPDPDDRGARRTEPGLNGGTLLEDVELIVPHQANKTMILQLAAKAGRRGRPAVLQHRDDGQRLLGVHPDGDRRRRARQGDHRAHADLRAGLRRGRGRRLRGADHRPGDHRARGGRSRARPRTARPRPPPPARTSPRPSATRQPHQREEHHP